MAAWIGAGMADSCCLTTAGPAGGEVCDGLWLGDFCTGAFIFGVGAIKEKIFDFAINTYTANLCWLVALLAGFCQGGSAYSATAKGSPYEMTFHNQESDTCTHCGPS